TAASKSRSRTARAHAPHRACRSSPYISAAAGHVTGSCAFWRVAMPISPAPRASPKFATALASARAASEDRLLVEQTSAGLLVVVADGAGGMVGGARAAGMVVEHVRTQMTEE